MDVCRDHKENVSCVYWKQWRFGQNLVISRIIRIMYRVLTMGLFFGIERWQYRQVQQLTDPINASIGTGADNARRDWRPSWYTETVEPATSSRSCGYLSDSISHQHRSWNCKISVELVIIGSPSLLTVSSACTSAAPTIWIRSEALGCLHTNLQHLQHLSNVTYSNSYSIISLVVSSRNCHE